MSTLEPQTQAANVRTRRRWRLLARMLLGCVIVVAAVAATVATAALLEVNNVVKALRHGRHLVIKGLTDAPPGAPQTILLIGSDKRAKGAIDANTPAHSDTMILVRLDPNQPGTTMLSIPRDLKVTIRPDHGQPTTQKINASYTIGGDKLAVKTIKQVLGIKINHVIDINFAGFKALVNYLGCIYVQVDRRYYHSNIGLAPSQTYDAIDIQPGYQKLCGDDALHYVRYRHTDTDLVRAARQQDFLRQIKNQVGANGLIARRVAIENIFGKYSQTDIHSEDDVLKLLTLAFQSAGHPIRQITFQATLGPSFVTATNNQISRTVHEFLNGGAAIGRISTAPQSANGHKPKKQQTPLTPATAEDLLQARTAAGSLPFPLYYPVSQVTSAGAPPDTLRPYLLKGPRHTYYAYVVVVAQGGLGQYYDLEGTTWATPPILTHPSQTIRLGGRTMRLYFAGPRLRVVAWRDGRGVYWLTNTLQNILTNQQMLAIAAAARPIK